MAKMNYGTAGQRSSQASATRYTDWRESNVGKKKRRQFSKPRVRRAGLLRSLAQKPQTEAERDQYAREVAAFQTRFKRSE